VESEQLLSHTVERMDKHLSAIVTRLSMVEVSVHGRTERASTEQRGLVGQTEGLGGQVLTSYTAKNIDVVFAFFIPLRFYRF